MADPAGLWRWLLAACLVVAGCSGEPEQRAPPAPSLRIEPVSFADLEGWAADDHAAALDVFRASCRKPPAPREGSPLGAAEPWREVCARAAAPAMDGPRAFFEREFVPARVTDGGDPLGLLTGYYEPLLEGARAPDPRHRIPLYGLPPDLVTADLGLFDDGWRGRRIAGRVDAGRLVPYPDREAIDGGALAGRGLELFWVSDPVDSFFLEIQGSGRIALAGGGETRVGFAGQNGHAYRAIGKDLIERGVLTRETVSMQAIRAWLDAHPDEAPALMRRNRSYVFFRELAGAAAAAAGPPGAQGLPLTPGRSIAVDRRFLPLGVPLWVDATAPFPEGDRALRRLVVAQDTGGAIRGVVRGDLFFGAGDLAEHLAGHMKSEARFYVLVPRVLAPVG